MKTASNTVCAIIVTYNRKHLLHKCLVNLQRQTIVPRKIVVVDNASTDSTREMLEQEFPEVTTLYLEQNIGGAGGFHEGVQWAFKQGFEWLWLMDDDTIAKSDTLSKLLEAYKKFPKEQKPIILTSQIIWVDGSLHKMNKPKPRKESLDRQIFAASCGALPIRFTTFVSLLLHSSAVQNHGLPLKKYFIWSDDVEYTARILKNNLGVLVPESIVIHETKENYRWLDAAPERFYFHVRNTIWLLMKSRAFHFKEKLVRGPRFIGGVLYYIYLSSTPFKSLRFLGKGLFDGIFDNPKRN